MTTSSVSPNSTTSTAEERPPLQMLLPTLEGLPSLASVIATLPPGYDLRCYRPEDETAWVDLMNTGEMGQWDLTRMHTELSRQPFPQFDPEGLFFITAPPNSHPIGSACAWLASSTEHETGILHRVCVLPNERGKRLSYILCLAVLHRFLERGFRRVLLNTREWRLGAIKIYLELGFKPLYRQPSHPKQWHEVFKKLSWTRDISPIDEHIQL